MTTAQEIAADMLAQGWAEYYARTGDSEIVLTGEEIDGLAHADAVALAREVRSILVDRAELQLAGFVVYYLRNQYTPWRAVVVKTLRGAKGIATRRQFSRDATMQIAVLVGQEHRVIAEKKNGKWRDVGGVR